MTKYCPGCKLTRPTSDFSPSRQQSGGFRSYCRPCNAQRKRKARRERKQTWTKRRYAKKARPVVVGICPICDTFTRLHWDHDHQTGKFRAYICPPCNRGLGCFRDNAEALHAAADYIDTHKEAPIK